jgi:competence protein ComEC
MYWALLCFCAGTTLVGVLPTLPNAQAVVLLLLGALLASLSRRLWWLMGCLLGLAYGLSAAQDWLEQNLPERFEGSSQRILARVTTVPEAVLDRYRFEVQVASGIFKDRRFQLLTLEGSPPQVGETWSLPVRLFRPRGTVNPGLFDYEAWQLQAGHHGSGYVLPTYKAYRLSRAPPWYHFHTLRQQIDQYLQTNVTDPVLRGALAALIIGSSEQLSKPTWVTLTRTGTNHLFVVSGLHLSLVAAAIFFCLRLLRLRAGVCVILVLLMVGIYSLLVGFGLPVQRALVMTTLGLLLVHSKRLNLSLRVMVLALVTVSLINPFAPLSAGFWLSFMAVTGLLLGFAGYQSATGNPIIIYLRTQWVALLVTAPILLLWIAQVPLISVFANATAVPILGLLLVPLVIIFLALFLTGCHDLAAVILALLERVLGGLLQWLNCLSERDWTHAHWLEFGPEFFLCVLGSALLLLPRGLVPRWWGLFCWLPVFTVEDAMVAPEDYLQVTVLDVGQGLSVLVTTPQTTLVYDTGPSSLTSDAATQILLPTLRKEQRAMVDLLIVSHGDDDHAGGVEALIQAIPVQRTLSSDPNHGPNCIEGETKIHDLDISWRALSGRQLTRNAASCVFEIRHGLGSVLLPGDVDVATEFRLNGFWRPVDLLISPHHGSQSSSSTGFINRVAPKWVIHAAGHGNSFGHPHPAVVARYQNRGIRQYVTATEGAVTVRFSQGRVTIQRARQTHRRFWYDD